MTATIQASSAKMADIPPLIVAGNISLFGR
jgi:hypothetical protein